MKSRERQEQLLAHLLKRGSARLGDLRERFQVSEGTIRNDLRELERQGKLIRTHGGATTVKAKYRGAITSNGTNNEEDSISERRFAQIQHIAHRAVELVNEGDSILLSGGETTRAMVDELLPKKGLTVITNSVEIAQQLSHNPSHSIVLIGGQVHFNSDSVDGPMASGMLERMRVGKAFIDCEGVSAAQGFASNYIADAQVKASMASCADSVVMLATHEALGKLALMSFASLNQAHHLITTHTTHNENGNGIASDAMNALMTAGVRISLCGERITEVCADCPPDHTWRIGFANLTEDQDFSAKVRQSVERAAQALGNIELVLADNASDPHMALQNGRRMLEANLDLLIEYQQDERTNYMLMDMFRADDMPVIAVDIPMPGAVYFGADNYRAGRMAGEAAAAWITKHWGGKLDKIVCLEQRESGSIPAARIQGTLVTLRNVINVKDNDVVYCDTHGMLDESRTAATNALRNIPWGKKVLFIGINANSALGALEAAEVLGRQSCTAVVSQNASRRVRSELRRNNPMLIGAVDYFPEAYGDRIMQLAVGLLSDRPVPPATYTDHALITHMNVQRFYPDDVDEVAALPVRESSRRAVLGGMAVVAK
ncbi:MAG: substrate-binding domain-containing protein [Anaerolineae bacterium]|nr:substrate-binding domain-containing protein [Anaerolineae bacterium]